MTARGSAGIGSSLIAVLGCMLLPREAWAAGLDWIRVDPVRNCLVMETSGERFVPWGFNYDHDHNGQLLEDYWSEEWDRVEGDFREMKGLGANLVRVHLQLGRFMRNIQEEDESSLARLEKLTVLADKHGLYLDLTGLGCYHKADVPPWYDALEENERWEVQARFWGAVARRCAMSSAVFCYDLMNEPVVPGAGDRRADWLGAPFAGKHFVQFISLDTQGRARGQIAGAWMQRLVQAIREVDRRHLITVGLVSWSLDRPGQLSSGFTPELAGQSLDFISVHLYPERGRWREEIDTLRAFAVAKPVLVEEMFPLKCSLDEFDRFWQASRTVAGGWVGFYWGQPPEELEKSGTLPDGLMQAWLQFFSDRAERAKTGAGLVAE